MIQRKTIFFLIFALIGIILSFSTCENQEKQTQPETEETEVVEIIEAQNTAPKKEPEQKSVDPEIADLKNVRVYTDEDFANVQPIYDIDMVIVEGGSMEIRGKMVSVDSFYMNKYELTLLVAQRAYSWGVDHGYFDESYNFKLDKTDYRLRRETYLNSIRICNYLSILDGYKPVYYKENRRDPVLRSEDTYEILSSEAGVIEGRYIPFFIDWEADGYRLPTEVEWEFAARGGIHSKGYTYAGSNNLDEVAWFDLSSGESNIDGYSGAPVKQKKPNELGLYDMSGNAAEWVINPWIQGDTVVQEHNPGRISSIINIKILQIKGGSAAFSGGGGMNRIEQYNPRISTIADFQEEGSDMIELNSNYDILTGGFEAANNTIRLVRNKLP